MFNNIILEKAARCVKTYGFRIGILDASLDDSGGILYLNSRGLARVQSPLWGGHEAATHGLDSSKMKFRRNLF